MTERPSSAGPGRLVLVATPIGNLGDLSPRAAAALTDADLVACEDTRRTRTLLSAAGISGKRLLSVHDANEAKRAEDLTARLTAGTTVVLVSDAGTPAVSDPGQRVVAAAVAAGIEVVAVPGPSAVIAALVLSGLPTDRFVFEGFLPRKGVERARRLAALAAERSTTVLYEAPHRVVRTVDDLAAACGEGRRVALARELTKVHEEVWRSTLGQALEALAVTPPRGEYVVVVEGAAEPAAAEDTDIEAALVAAFNAGHDRRGAVAAVATALDARRRRVYELALRLPPPAPPPPEAQSAAHAAHTARPR
ncbi:MAG: 16S rRNA (cytidine(1402)-2'-O)-methyltransferase [Acidimicrobiales bacterium]